MRTAVLIAKDVAAGRDAERHGEGRIGWDEVAKAQLADDREEEAGRAVGIADAGGRAGRDGHGGDQDSAAEPSS